MTSNAPLRNSTQLSRTYKQLYRLLLKQTKRDSFLDRLITRQPVTSFAKTMKTALSESIKATLPTLPKRVVEQLSKLEVHEIAQLNAIINEEYGGIEDFVSATQIQVFFRDVYNIGANHVLDKYAIPGSFDLTNPTVLAKLSDSSQYLIRTVDDTTKSWLARQLSDGLAQHLSWQDIADSIAKNAPDITQYRAELIARMETANAVNQSELDFYRQNGLMTKSWVLASSHSHDDECDDNADVGSISTYDTFPSGHDAPPAHVNCMCTIQTDIPEDFITNGPDWLGA